MKINLGYLGNHFAHPLDMTLAGAEEVAQPAIKTVDYDGQGRFRVNGKPFFPILLYGAATDGESLATFRDFGFNVLACRPEASDALPSQGFYAAVHGVGKSASTSGVLLAIGADSPALNFQKNLLEKVAEENAKTAAALPDRPVMNAIGYWEDEPAGVVSGKLPSKEKYDDLVAAIDVAAPYLYPVPYQPVASVGDALARARRAAGRSPSCRYCNSSPGKHGPLSDGRRAALHGVSRAGRRGEWHRLLYLHPRYRPSESDDCRGPA